MKIRVPTFHIGMPVVFPGMFSPEECEAIIFSFEKKRGVQGPVVFRSEGERKCIVKFSTPKLMEKTVGVRLRELFPAIGKYYDFEHSGNFESYQYCGYAPGGHVDWHCDLGYEGTQTRKVTLVVQLSDGREYVGGDLEFMPGGVIPDCRQQGSVAVFPSFLAHRVNVIKRGHRNTLVTWLHGPVFS